MLLFQSVTHFSVSTVQVVGSFFAFLYPSTYPECLWPTINTWEPFQTKIDIRQIGTIHRLVQHSFSQSISRPLFVLNTRFRGHRPHLFFNVATSVLYKVEINWYICFGLSKPIAEVDIVFRFRPMSSNDLMLTVFHWLIFQSRFGVYQYKTQTIQCGNSKLDWSRVGWWFVTKALKLIVSFIFERTIGNGQTWYKFQ
jgi:hypothetical protein